jgi:hypothetical protein
MSTFSAPMDYSATSDNCGIIAQEISAIDPSIMANISAAAGGLDTVTISNGTGSSYYYTGAGIGGSSNTITISGTGYTIGTINSINTSTFTWKNEEFVNCLPDFDRIQKMCEQYPGLKIAFEKFKTTYKLVKDHYDTPEDQRPIP